MGAGVGAFGPYKVGNRWRVLVRTESGGPGGYRSFASEREATDYKNEAAEALRETVIETIADAITEYEELLKKNNRESSYKETPRRLRWILAGVLENTLEALTPGRCERLYKEICEAVSPATRRVYAVDTCKNTLAETKTFINWCISKKWIKENGFAGIKDKRERKHGKEQLTRDEARKFDAIAFSLAKKGDLGAVAALMTLTMGLRASEITKRVVRDLDDGGAVLVVEKGKTKKSNREVKVPEYLRPFLQAAIAKKKPTDLIFQADTGGAHWRDWPAECVRRICRLAGVREVCAHSMRGLHGSLGIEAGETPIAVARTLGHESVTTTMTSYVDRAAARRARQRTALAVLDGGKSRKRA